MNDTEKKVPAPTPPPAHQVLQLPAGIIQVDDLRYRLVADHKAGFQADALAAVYVELLAKYDYIVGDWGFDQLRLRGFYAEGHRHANRDQYISTLADYLYEFCNFGCAYFVLEKLPDETAPQS